MVGCNHGGFWSYFHFFCECKFILKRHSLYVVSIYMYSTLHSSSMLVVSTFSICWLP